jgi:hypothetical protein
MAIPHLFHAVVLAIVAFDFALAGYNVGVGIADVTGPAAEINMVQ